MSTAQERLDAMVSERPARVRDDQRRVRADNLMPDGKPFSPFEPGHAKLLSEVAARFVGAAARTKGGGDAAVNAVAAVRTEALGEGIPERLVTRAILVARVHAPQLKRLGRPPVVERRAPHRVVPSRDAGDSPPTDPEDAVRAFREDPALNDHHEQWHLVYPTGGLPWKASSRRERQGEMFLFMHQQKLARYHMERLSVGLDSVVPLDDYTAPIPDAYDPAASGDLLPDIQATAAARFAGAVLATDGIRDLEERRSRVDGAIAAYKDGLWGDQAWSAIDALGSVLESSVLPTGLSDLPRTHLHNRGHMVIADHDGDGVYGAMADPDSSMRDPVFWRWHRHIDNYGFNFQETHLAATPITLHEPPNVTLYNGDPADTVADILLLPAARLPQALQPPPSGAGVAAHFATHLADIAPWVNGNVDSLFAEQTAISPEVRTWYARRDIVFPAEGSDGAPSVTVPVWTLDHDDFLLVARIHNTSDSDQRLTLRWFFAPDAKVASVEDPEARRWWFEIDKQVHVAAPGSSVAVQPAPMVAAVRKPARRIGIDLDDPLDPDAGDDEGGWSEAMCNCGLPYTLLVPRGTPDGMRFRLYLCITDNAADQARQSTCGSMTYCGATDDYPDRKPMGFPFDRPVDGDVYRGPNRGWRPFTIRHVTQTP